MNIQARSWGGYPKLKPRDISYVYDRSFNLEGVDAPILMYGNGRSYGDVCLNEKGSLIVTRKLDRFISFDRERGILHCESGILLGDILDLIVDAGWFLPVTPGTQFVTLGGAVANDVHGKNHHSMASFGNHLLSIELLRSDGLRLICNEQNNFDLFSATIGGLGLTGAILSVQLKLIPISSPMMNVKTLSFDGLDDFWDLSSKNEKDWQYNVAWIDCLASKPKLGRGVMFLASHSERPLLVHKKKKIRKNFFINAPFSLVGNSVIKVFNELYYNRNRGLNNSIQSYIPFFYPLDDVLNWNRIYGRKGFFQYQCVIPDRFERDGVKELISIIQASGEGSFLAVLKRFGGISSKGLISFPRSGTTLALDFSNKDKLTLKLFKKLDGVVRECGGAIYPAKDARMSADLFRLGFPRFEMFSKFIDPAFSSSFSRRVEL